MSRLCFQQSNVAACPLHQERGANQDFDYRNVIVISDASERNPRCVPKGCCVFDVEPGGSEADREDVPKIILID